MSGYAGIAQRMTDSPDLGVIRCFASLNYQRLLYLQAELTGLETEWRSLEHEIDQRQRPEERYRSHSWEDLRKDADDWRKFETLGQKLKEYNEAIIQFNTVCKLQRPTRYSLSSLNTILNDVQRNEFLLGDDKHSWSEDRKNDLILASQLEEADTISLLFARMYLRAKYKVFRRQTTTGDVVYLEENSLLLFGKIVSTVLSSLLPVLGIVVLYAVKTMWRRLLILAAFTSLFSLTLALVTTSSKRLEVFAAAATFSAVLVVFIGTSN